MVHNHTAQCPHCVQCRKEVGSHDCRSDLSVLSQLPFPMKRNSNASIRAGPSEPYGNIWELFPHQVLTEFPLLTFNISFVQEDFLDFKDLGVLPCQFFKTSDTPAELKLESSAPERCRRHTILVVRSSCPARHQ